MGLRKWAIAALIVLMALGAMTPAMAWKAQELRADIGDIQFGWEWVLQKPSATLFHTENLASTDTEALAIAFPSQGSGGTLAPTIAQTSAATAAATDTGFFTANWCYTALVNAGGYDLVPDIGSWQPMRSAYPVGSGTSWPYMNNAPDGGTTMRFRPAINTSPDTGNASLQLSTGGQNSGALSGVNQSASLAAPKAGNASSSPGNAMGNSPKPNRDYKNMTKVDIKNMTGLEKMYRNAMLVNTVPKSYKGTVARPADIDPMNKPMDLIKPADKSKVIKDSLAMTEAGKHLKTLFWDL